MTQRNTHLPERPRTLLVADIDPLAGAQVREQLHAVGFKTLAASGLTDILEITEGVEVSGIVVCRTLAEDGDWFLLERLRERSGPQPFIVVRGPSDPSVMEAAYGAGADDYLSEQASAVELAGRVVGLLRNHDYFDRVLQKERDAQAMLELTQALGSSLEFSEILYVVVRRIAEVVNVDRASLVLVTDAEASEVGFVVATSDDQEISDLQIDLGKYPEILQVLRTGEPLTITDTETHPLLEGVRELSSLPVGALSLLPIVWQGAAFGVLFLRSSRRGALSSREAAFCHIVTNATAVALRNARVLQSLRAQTQKETFERSEAERRMRALKRYANLFTSAADGLAAVDRRGKLLFANPRAYQIIGATPAELENRSLRSLIPGDDWTRLSLLWENVKAGEFPTGVDLPMRRPDGTLRTVSCSFSELLEGEGAILVSFRDVTVERETERELVKTKEFLESLINASVDAIIAADLRGTILLFNRGAESIYGRSAPDVLGQLHVTKLYPEGGARQVMELLRSPGHGGVGRLESIRFDARDVHGDLVPITLSAAMIYDELGQPSATVGIFTDLREKLRVEERLAQAQEQLEISEKQALIAELAGTTAHELNQPLTSVIGYAELLHRKLPAHSPERHAADVIGQEAERIADIVRKIGKITRYETKSYVGRQKIIDLDKSIEDAEGRG